MKRIALRLLVISSATLLWIAAADGRTRPRYGGTLRAASSFGRWPANGVPAFLVGPVFETLVTLDDKGQPQPALATSWTVSSGGRRWEIILRKNVHFSDGQPVTPGDVAVRLQRIDADGWTVGTTADSLIFESKQPDLNFPALLSLPEFAISAEKANGHPVGTGPFLIAEEGPLRLLAVDDYWGGRPYVDEVQIATDRQSRDQVAEFALDRTDVAEIGADQWRRAQQEHWRTDASRPAETVLLNIVSTKRELQDARIREAISLAIDRASIHNVIFQRRGEVGNGLLPNWLTGYEFLFAAPPDLSKARELLSWAGRVPPLTIGYDASNAVDRVIAERVALNVRDIGISMSTVPNSASVPDIRIQHVVLPSLDPSIALDGDVKMLRILPVAHGTTPEALYNNERAALHTYLAIPLVHLPRITAVKDRVRNWTASPLGEWRFEYLWIAPRSNTREAQQ